MIKVETFIQMLGNYTRPPQRIYLISLGAKLYVCIFILSFINSNYLDESVIFNLCIIKGLRTKL
jgi:hypothetical protein